jgi:hypothetical protein
VHGASVCVCAACRMQHAACSNMEHGNKRACAHVVCFAHWAVCVHCTFTISIHGRAVHMLGIHRGLECRCCNGRYRPDEALKTQATHSKLHVCNLQLAQVADSNLSSCRYHLFKLHVHVTTFDANIIHTMLNA